MNPTVRNSMRVKVSRAEGIERGKQLGREELLAELAQQGSADGGPAPLKTLDDIKALSGDDINSRWEEVRSVLEAAER